ncbi:MAG: DUF2520 domain-containing protein, partial [Desulfatitalea sp.]|nr:DUF2520 domain-containing protein [Desulfatitalea sp.]NNK02257.1 DUF2520 domain-containing protein [Desulfatitalea sp.]
AKALTGPIARGDVTTVAHHLAALTDDDAAELRAFYIDMGLKTLDLAEQDMLQDPDKVDAIRKVLRP